MLGQSEEAQAAEFNVGRYFLEVLVGAAAGTLAAYGVYTLVCDGGSDCFGAALAGLGANIAITPLAVFGVGRALGGQGGLGWTYVGGLAAFAGAAAPDNPGLVLLIGSILMPFSSAFLFEITSGAAASQMASGPRTTWQASVTPLISQGELRGAGLEVSGQF